MNFLDRVQIKLSSGKGGRGFVHFQRTRRSPRAGPDGGDGGRGGDLILSPNSSIRDFSHLSANSLYKAEDGQPGQGGKRKGAKGKDLLISVPQGTLCYDSKGRFLKELKDEKYSILKGGKGGKGNHFFKSSREQAPQFAKAGAPACQKTVTLELKWISDVSLIGFRGVGKTSFLLNMGAFREKLCPSSYPRIFSVPVGGKKAQTSPFRLVKKEQDIAFLPDSILFVDLPGLSSSTRRFLKQAERSSMIIFVLSLTDINPFASYQKLKKYLLLYDQEHKSKLTQKPFILLLMGKKDSNSLKKIKSFYGKSLKFFPFFSVKSQAHIDKLMDEIIKTLFLNLKEEQYYQSEK